MIFNRLMEELIYKVYRQKLLAMASVMALFFSVSLQAQSLTHFEKQSGEFRPYFIELFTSQGCSSCPPADAWLSEFAEEEGLWTNYFPIAFHVTYWDYIGWKDPYGSRQFSQRQYDHLNQLNIRQVYTPQFVVNGKEWKGWFKRLFGNTFEQAPERVGQLSIKLVDGDMNLTFDSTQDLSDKKVTVHLAMLGAGLTTPVTRGENRNKQLKHDFTVLEYQSFTPIVTQNLAGYAGKVEAFSVSMSSAPRLAWMAWVEVEGKSTQAVAAWLDN